jgi:hypothetical protein
MGDLTDDLLELVLLSIRSPSCLVRAAATCKPWRRVIANAAFIRCFRCLHGPHVLGHYHYMGEGDKTVLVPSLTPTPGEAGPVIDLVSLGLFAGSDYVELTDSRGGLLAFVRPDSAIGVCSPWTGRYRRIRRLPSTRAGDDVCIVRTDILGAFLLDADEPAAADGMSNFRVLCVHVVRQYNRERTMVDRMTAAASVYSEKDRSWLCLSSTAVISGSPID